MHYLLHIWGNVEPQLFGPYMSAKTRNVAAKRRARASTDRGGFFKLLVVPKFKDGELTSQVSVSAFTAAELGREDQ